MKFIFILRFEQIFLIPLVMECSSVRPVVINDWSNIPGHLSVVMLIEPASKSLPKLPLLFVLILLKPKALPFLILRNQKE